MPYYFNYAPQRPTRNLSKSKQFAPPQRPVILDISDSDHDDVSQNSDFVASYRMTLGVSAILARRNQQRDKERQILRQIKLLPKAEVVATTKVVSEGSKGKEERGARDLKLLRLCGIQTGLSWTPVPDEVVIAFLKTAMPELASLNVEVLAIKVHGDSMREAIFSVPSVEVAVHLHRSHPRVDGHKFRGIITENAHIVHSDIDAAKLYLARIPTKSFSRATKHARTGSMTHVSASQSQSSNSLLAHKPTSSRTTTPLASITNIPLALPLKSTQDQSHVQPASSLLLTPPPERQLLVSAPIKSLPLVTDDDVCMEPLATSFRKLSFTTGVLRSGAYEGSSPTSVALDSRSIADNQTSLNQMLPIFATVSNIVNDLDDLAEWANGVVADAQKVGGFWVDLARLDMAMNILYRPRSHAHKRGWSEAFDNQ